jgi:hypothetical protein
LPAWHLRLRDLDAGAIASSTQRNKRRVCPISYQSAREFTLQCIEDAAWRSDAVILEFV